MNTRFSKISCLLALAVACVAAPALGQPADPALSDELEALKQGQQEIQRQIEIEKEIDALKQGQQEILKQLAELKNLVQARPAAAAPARGSQVAGKIFDVGDNPVKGVDTAKLTLVEFTDYQ